MNQSRKINLLYQKAKGQSLDNVTWKEQIELKRYKIYADEGDFYTTKSNISAYVEAVDHGKTRLSFQDWCLNHGKADRRRKGSSKKDIAEDNASLSGASMMMGWLTWGIAIYWMAGEQQSVGSCMIMGIVVSFILSKISRRYLPFNIFILPAILAAVFWGNIF